MFLAVMNHNDCSICGLLCISFGLVLCPMTITLLSNERSKLCKVIHSKDELSVIVKCCDVVY